MRNKDYIFLLPIRCGEEVEHGCDSKHGSGWYSIPLKPEGQERRGYQDYS
jgi:hypothetical protein